jgi:hypothetical protein
MTDSPPNEPDSEDREYSFRYEFRILVTFLIAAWIVVGTAAHVILAWEKLAGHRHSRVEYSFGFPAIKMVDSPGLTTGGGIVAPGPDQGPTGPGNTHGGPSVTTTCTDDPTKPGLDCDTCEFVPKPIKDLLARVHIRVPEWICKALFVLAICYLVKLIFQGLLEWVCSSEWIKDRSVRRKCRRKRCKWWCGCCNKWWCFLLVIIQWILQQVCRWVEALSWLVFAACVIVGLILILA